jgi:hypothetical protein
MHINDDLKREIYLTLADFLNAYRTEDIQTLNGKYDISGQFWEEIYEMLDFVEDKSNLRLFPMEEMDKEEGGAAKLQVFASNHTESVVGIEAYLYNGQEWIGLIKGIYEPDGLPQFTFHYFST